MTRAAWTGGRRSAIGWALYDWANSPFTTVVTTFIFAAYFAEAIAVDKTAGASQWAFMQGAAAFAIALLSPVLGAIADHGRGRKAWIVFWTLVMAAASAALWWSVPGPGSATLVLSAAFIGIVGFELAIVFYNAMLPGLAPQSHLGRLSGWSWGLGYVGGLACLVLLLFAFVQPEIPPFGLDRETAEHVRIAGPVVALWALAFSLPLFFLTADTPGAGLPAGRAIGAGLRQLGATLTSIRKHRNIARFLIARIFYILGGAMGVFFGPAQAASRSLMSHLLPKGQEAEMFGLYAFAGRCTAFLGPWIFGVVTLAAGHRWGMATVIPFLVVGALILLRVEERIASPAARS